MSLRPWHDAAWEGLRRRLERGQLPHAILLAGAAGLGKRVLAAHLAAAVLCSEAPAGEPCGQCRSCRLRSAGTHPDLHLLALELNTQGNLRKEIVVDQVRAMSRQLAMTSQLGGYQLALIDPADHMNRAAANALLKTLEEPARDTILVLLADQPWRLPATVRSRCQTFTLHAPARQVALAWLREQGIAQPDQALDAAGGNPGLARRWQADGMLELQRAVHDDLHKLASGTASVAAITTRWADQQAEQRLGFATRFAAAEMKRRARGTRDGGSTLDDLALLDWYRHSLRAAEDLRGPLRPGLVLFPLLTAWR